MVFPQVYHGSSWDHNYGDFAVIGNKINTN